MSEPEVAASLIPPAARRVHLLPAPPLASGALLVLLGVPWLGVHRSALCLHVPTVSPCVHVSVHVAPLNKDVSPIG